MRELINGKAANIIMLLVSFVFFMFSIFGKITIMVVVFGLYLLTFILRLMLPVRNEMPMPAEIPDAEYM